MKNFTYLLRYTFVLLCLLISSSTFSQTVIGGPYDFETGNDGWTLGGGDAQRVVSGTVAYSNSWSIRLRDNSGTASAMDSPTYSLSAYDKVDFKFFFSANDFEADEDFFIEYRDNSSSSWTIVATYKAYDPSSGTAANQGDFQRDDTSSIMYGKTATILKTNYTFPAAATAQFRVRSDASDNNDNLYVDYITITGTTFATPTTGPGGITSNLDLWLRADKLDGSAVGTDGANVSKWTDNGKGNHAETVVSGQEPVYRNNSTNNFNFNPVIDFENDHNTAGRNMTYLDSRDVLQSTDGFNSNDLFIVIMPDPTITTSMWPLDTFTGHDITETSYGEDVTGFGYGSYSQRFTNERFSYCVGTSSGVNVGFGRADTGTTDYNQISIINARHNSGNSDMELYFNAQSVGVTSSDIPDFAAINDSKYWIGRSQHFDGSFDGKIAEIITYDSRKTDGSAERRRIESYLALKYGVTLGANGTSMDYVDSSGNVVWDQSADSALFNYDIAGIFRDDSSNHEQKQSKSVNPSSVVTIGHKDIATTNSANTNSFDTDLDYLVWGHNNAALSGSNTISVNLGASSSSVTTLFDRRWKILESGNDVLDVKVSIPSSVLPAKAANDEYAMIVSSTSSFGASDIVDVIPMVANGANFETWYDFDGTRFFTFGIASIVSGKFNVEFASGDFLVGEDVVDLNSTYTVSSWVRDLGSGGNYVSKGTAYNFEVQSGGTIRVSINGNNYTSSTSINDTNWHHIAHTYTGGTLRLYIDGVEDANSPFTSVAAPVSTSDRFAIGVNYTDKNNISTSFNGDIDEVRIWDRALTQTQIQYIMNQEIIEHTDNTVDGDIIPQSITSNDVSSIPWSDMQAYHNINEFYGTTVVDGSDNTNWVRIKYLVTGKNIIDDQSAPLPYKSIIDGGNWDTQATWEYGSEMYTPGSASIVDSNVTVDWNIVQLTHDVTMNNTTLPAVNNDNRTLLGLFAGATKELTVSSDNGLTVTHYLELNGLIDLEGESQLMQTDNSVLTVGANGSLERDQQGTSDLYTYNYWSSPVGAVSTSATNSTTTFRYTVPDVLMNGTTPATPGAITFLGTGYNGSSSPFSIADYWIWKYANLLDGDYNAWQHMRSTGTIYAGEGYTMKGPGTGTILAPQNYVFEGKPNNGDITLTISANNDYLVGNPYPSAIDAHEFIDDNPATSGTLYFWEHWGGNSHILGDYQGGYALYNYSGGVPSPSYGTNHPDVGTGGTPVKLPGQYIPVSQGFFVYSAGGGTITFENDQRIFEREGVNSTFVRLSSEPSNQAVNYNEDDRMKFRIGFNSSNELHRQLLLTVDENASQSYDRGYDGRLNGSQIDDMYWMIENEKYAIQGTNIVNTETVAPLGVHVRDNGLNKITLDHLENVPDDMDIYAHDNVLDIYHNLRESDYEVHLTTGEYLNRFSIVFTNPEALSIEENELNDTFELLYDNDSEKIIVHNPTLVTVNSLSLFNILGQSIMHTNSLETENYSEIKVLNLSSGTYIVNLNTEKGKVTKKVLVK